MKTHDTTFKAKMAVYIFGQDIYCNSLIKNAVLFFLCAWMETCVSDRPARFLFYLFFVCIRELE